MLLGLSITEIVEIIASLLVAMTLHEMMHAYVGYLLGDTTASDEGRISINPLRHIDPLTTLLLPVVTLILFHAPILAARPVPYDSSRIKFGDFGTAMLAVAGPFTNLALAIVGAGLFRVFSTQIAVSNALYIFVVLNISLFVFNLIPIPPLDGSRVLYAFAPEKVQDVMRQLESFGLMIVLALALLGGFAGALANINQFVLRILL